MPVNLIELLPDRDAKRRIRTMSREYSRPSVPPDRRIAVYALAFATDSSHCSTFSFSVVSKHLFFSSDVSIYMAPSTPPTPTRTPLQDIICYSETHVSKHVCNYPALPKRASLLM